MASVVVVEDHAAIRKSLSEFLGQCGHQVGEAASAIELYQLLGNQTFDVAVVDINLPHHDGFSVTQYLSENGLCSVIITTVRDAVEDRVKGYRSGADIYMVKPIEPEELAAAVVRLAGKRQALAKASVKPAQSWTLDEASQLLWSPAGRVVALTRREVHILAAVARMPAGLITREALQMTAGETSARGSLDTLISRLRSKVRREIAQELPLVTAHSAGFSLLAPLRLQ